MERPIPMARMFSKEILARGVKKLAHNFWRRVGEEGQIIFQHYTTPILTIYDDRFVVETHYSVTTKKHLNAHLPYGHISQVKGDWFFNYKGCTEKMAAVMHFPASPDIYVLEHSVGKSHEA